MVIKKKERKHVPPASSSSVGPGGVTTQHQAAPLGASLGCEKKPLRGGQPSPSTGVSHIHPDQLREQRINHRFCCSAVICCRLLHFYRKKEKTLHAHICRNCSTILHGLCWRATDLLIQMGDGLEGVTQYCNAVT